MAERAVVSRLGSAGDGVAEGKAAPIHIPYALPGETVTIEREGARGRLLSVETASPDRVEPFCPYFGRCGGCVAQHIAPSAYAAWKRGRLAAALAGAGIAAVTDLLVDAHGEGRRRVTFHAREVDGAMEAGFMAARSHSLVPIDACPITVPALQPAARIARDLANRMRTSGKPIDLSMTTTLGGLDVDLRGSGALPERIRQELIGDAQRRGLARLSLHGDILVELQGPRIAIGRAEAILPPGGFLQATAAGEETLAGVVARGCEGARRVADLFAGIGSFALRLAESAEVHAVEQDAASVSALDRAARATPGLRRITTEVRDLFRRPLLAPELERFEAVVVNPPRAGAEAQARQLILSSCSAVILVSCDPGTFARDAATLIAGGFAPERIVPVDQFKWSAHLEIVGIFRRPRKATRPRRRF